MNRPEKEQFLEKNGKDEYDKWKSDHAELDDERNPYRVVTEQSHVDMKTQVETLIRYGERLRMARIEEQFDLDGKEKVSDAPIDPTRDSNFDMADADRIMKSLNEKLKEKEDDNEGAKGTTGNANENSDDDDGGSGENSGTGDKNTES